MKGDKDKDKDDAKKQKVESEESSEDEEANNEVLKDFHEQQKKYAVKKQTLPAKGLLLTQFISFHIRTRS